MLRRPPKTKNNNGMQSNELTTPLLLNTKPSSPPPNHTPPMVEERARLLNPPSRIYLFFRFLRRSLEDIFDVIHCFFSTTSSLFIRLLTSTSHIQNDDLHMSLLQSQRLDSLRQRIATPYDSNNPDHVNSLKKLWSLAFPNETFPATRKSPRWQDMGWQGQNPETDFRGGGLLSLELLIYMAEKEPDAFFMLMDKKQGVRSNFEYPFAVAGVHLTVMITEVLELGSSRDNNSVIINNRSADKFMKLLGESETALESIFVETFKTLDEVWLLRRGTYMKFPKITVEVKYRLKRMLQRRRVTSVEHIHAIRTEYM